jgi:hypothetical protein
VWSSRLAWHAGLLPLGTVIFVRCLFAVAVDGRSAALIPTLVLLAALTQLHLTAVALFPLVLIALAAAPAPLRWRHAAIGTALAALLYAPLLAHDATHGGANAGALAAAVLGDGGASPGAAAAVLVNALRLYRPALAGFFPGGPGAPAVPTIALLLHDIEAVLVATGILVVVRRLIRRWRSERALGPAGRADGFLLLWAACPLFLLGARATPMWWYYFDLLYPSQFVLAGIALAVLGGAGAPAGSGSPARVAAAACLAGALVISQTATVLAFQREAARRCELVIDVTRFPINGAISPFGRLTSLPLGCRSRLVRVLRHDLGVGADGFARRVHGAALGLPEESEVLVRSWSRRGPTDPGTRDMHYLIEREDTPAASLAGAREGGLRTARVGAFRAVEYRPTIDYASWRYGTVDSPSGGAAPVRWEPLGPAWPHLDVDVPGGGLLILRGALDLPAGETARRIAVSITAWAIPTATELTIDGVRARRIDHTVRQEPLMLGRGSRWLMGAGWRTDVLFDLGDPVTPGRHVLEVRVVGPAPTIAVDVFESGRSSGSAGSG